MQSSTQGADFSVGNSLPRAVKLTKDVDPDKYRYSGYGIGFNSYRSFSLSNDSGFRKNIIKFGADMSASVHIDNKKKRYLDFW